MADLGEQCAVRGICVRLVASTQPSRGDLAGPGTEIALTVGLEWGKDADDLSFSWARQIDTGGGRGFVALAIGSL